MDAYKLDAPDGAANFTPSIHQDTYPFVDTSKVDLNGKHVLVTGASRGVGKAIAISYARAGASGVAILARSDLSKVACVIEDAAVKAGRQKPKILMLKADISQVYDCSHVAKKIEEAFGQLDVLINNAGYLETFKKIDESDPDDWWKTFEINVKGVYLMTRALLPLVLKSGLKTIVTTSSVGAHVILPGASAYQTTKLAELRLNDFLMAEYAEEGLLAYGIHPGGVKTDLAHNMPEYIHQVLTDEPELVGDTIVWLTKERREWLADRYVSVTWDMEELLSKRKEIEDRNLLRVRLRV